MFISLPRFHVFRSDRPDSFGRVAIDFHSSIKANRIIISNNIKLLLCVYLIGHLRIKLFSNYNKQIQVWSISIPPLASPSETIISNIFSLMSPHTILCYMKHQSRYRRLIASINRPVDAL